MDLKYLLSKYGDIIKEEVNVKQLEIMPEDVKVEKIYVPIGSMISKKYWKDTWKIIKLAKTWNVKDLDNWKIEVFDESGNSWILEPGDYEIRYLWLDEKTMAAEWNVVVKLDLTLTPQLIKEWIARQLARFINQLRKEANYNVEDRIDLYWQSDSDMIKEVINQFDDFLKREWLLKNIFVYKQGLDYDICQDLDIEEYGKIKFCLKK